MRLSILLVAALAACTPPAEPPPTTTTTEVTTTEPPVDPPPTTTVPEPEGREPSEYITMERAPGISEELTAALQENAWAGRTDILAVADRCSWALLPSVDALFPYTHDGMQELARVGARLDREGLGFLERLSTVNKRCADDDRFCGRSDVLRSRLSEFRGRLTAHLETARALRDGLRGQPGYGVDFNSIKGWCEEQQ